MLVFQHGTNKSRDSKGNYYVTLTHVGLKEEGVPALTDADKDAIWTGYWTMLNEYLAAENAAVVEWRLPPNLVEEAGGKYWVRSRLSVIERNDG